jgi:hypothetical protein
MRHGFARAATAIGFCDTASSPFKTSVRADALQPLPVPARQFDSVGMNFLLHCLPGDWPAKGSVFAHAATALQPGGQDDLAGLEQQLASHFAEYRVTVRGTVALFEASVAATS